MGGLHLCLERERTNCMTIQYDDGACNLLFLIFLFSSHSFET